MVKPYRRSSERYHWTTCLLLSLLLQCGILWIPTLFAFAPTVRVHHVLCQTLDRVTASRDNLSAFASTDDLSESNDPLNDTTQAKSLISAETIEKLKESVDIVSVIESYGLEKFTRKSHLSAQAVCPFHDDHNPSMSIDSNRRIFKCFACGEGGDVFRFVRSYSALQGKSMTFYESVRHVAQTWGDPNSLSSLSHPQQSWIRNETEEQRKARERKRRRLLTCHAIAADFYGKNLISLPAAGIARTYLRLRGFSPATVQTFALGYAHDSYYSSQLQTKKSSWGEGSLVNHLRSQGFSAAEIVEAGLAVQTKRASWADVVLEEFHNDDSTDSDAQFMNLMDRFRGRVIVPIFDEHGENVIAFGGRILPRPGDSTETAPTDSKSPKYLNSPETPIFSKKRELFGLGTLEGQKNRHDGAGHIIIVEGYMDVIALWEAGIREAVASMGSALTFEQLEKAAKTAGANGGRITLCLDSDEAGIAGIERLCSSHVIRKICEKYAVEVFVAALPNGVKDPGEYVESKVGDSIMFRSNVLDCAVEWSRWYTKRIISQYDPGATPNSPSSFADICVRIADFLASFTNSLDRTRRSHEVAGMLARTIMADSNSSSSALQIQLESDLINMVARRAAARESVERRVQSVEGFGAQQNNTMIMKRMIEGGSTTANQESSKLARNATKPSQFRHESPRGNRLFKQRATEKEGTLLSSTPYKKGDRTKFKRRVFRQEPLIPHFSGIKIKKSTDADWLGTSKEKWRKESHHLTFGAPVYNKTNRHELVFFNSNEFHGDQFLTEEAANAGYKKGKVSKDAALLEKGVGVLITVDHAKRARRAEDVLLRNLVRYPSTRSAISVAVATSDATGASADINWSSQERGWLFHILVSQSTTMPHEMKSPELLRKFLSTRSDAPVGAFGGNPNGNDVSPDLITKQVVSHRSHGSSTTVAFRRGIVDANIVFSGENNEFATANGITEDSQTIDDWSAHFDPSILDFDMESDGVTTLEEWPAKDGSGIGVVNTDAVIDVKLADVNNREDVGRGSLSRQQLAGTLDRFFVEEEEDIFGSTYDSTVDREFRAELEVQEALAHLLRASAATKLSNVNSNWLIASGLLDSRLGSVDADDQDVTSGIKELDSMNIGDLQLYCESLLTRLQQLRSTVLLLDTSADRISSRLMEYSRGDAAEGHISVSKQAQLFNEIEDFLSELSDDYEPPEAGIQLMDPLYVLSLFDQPGEAKRGPRSMTGSPHDAPTFNKDLEEKHFHDDMDMIERSWRGMDDDDYIWSMPDESNPIGREMLEYRRIESSVEDELEEPLEDAISRIEEEWGDWDVDSSNLRTSTSHESSSLQDDVKSESHVDLDVGGKMFTTSNYEPDQLDSQWE